MTRFAAIVLSMAALTSLAVEVRQSNVIRTAESGIRRLATQKPAPVYPAASIAQKRTGVAVAAIVSQPDGRVATVTMLEAPDEAIGAAMREALLKWVIAPMTVQGRTDPYGVSGKVTFYFRIEKGQGRVLSPEEMPGGPMPEPAGGPPARGPGTGTPPVTGTKPPPATTVTHDVPADIEIGEPELKRLLASEKATVLDIRERDDFKRAHFSGAVNIPRDELVARGGIELDRTRPVIIDCSRSETNDCRNAANSLIRGKRYPKVLIYLP